MMRKLLRRENNFMQCPAETAPAVTGVFFFQKKKHKTQRRREAAAENIYNFEKVYPIVLKTN